MLKKKIDFEISFSTMTETKIRVKTVFKTTTFSILISIHSIYLKINGKLNSCKCPIFKSGTIWWRLCGRNKGGYIEQLYWNRLDNIQTYLKRWNWFDNIPLWFLFSCLKKLVKKWNRQNFREILFELDDFESFILYFDMTILQLLRLKPLLRPT